MTDGARQHQAANAADYDLIVNGIGNETDMAEQVNLVEQMIAQRVDAIVIAPADSKALVTMLKRAKGAGILVVNIDNKCFGRRCAEAGGFESSVVGSGQPCRGRAGSVIRSPHNSKRATGWPSSRGFQPHSTASNGDWALRTAWKPVVGAKHRERPERAMGNGNRQQRRQRDAGRTCGPSVLLLRERQHGSGRGRRSSKPLARLEKF